MKSKTVAMAIVNKQRTPWQSLICPKPNRRLCAYTSIETNHVESWTLHGPAPPSERTQTPTASGR